MTDLDYARPMAQSDKRADPALQEQFAVALRHHQAGRLTAAGTVYRQILESQPCQADALHLLGLLAHQTGQHRTALALADAAIASNAAIPAYQTTRGNAARALGQNSLADHSFRRALALRPDHAEAHHGLGLTLAAQGRTARAAEHLRTALICRPETAEIYNDLGLAEQSRQQAGAATRCFERGCRIRPHFADLQNNLGLQRGAAGLPHYRRAILCAPDLAEAYGNLGNQWAAQGAKDASLVLLRRALRLRPDDATTRYNIANILQDDSPDDSLAACHGALACQPAQASAHNLIGQMLLRHGDLTAAAKRYRRALICRTDPVFLNNLAAVQRFSANDADLAALRRLADQAESLTTEARITLDFALGKAYDDCGDSHRAFHHYQEANRRKRSQISYDERLALTMIERTRQAFPGELIVGIGGQGDPSTLPIFILGMPRSGSTLIEQILASHPQVHGGGERRDFPDLLESVGYPEPAAALRGPGFRALGADYVARVGRLAPSAARITDKLPVNFLYAGAIYLALPQARIIHSRRDPTDTCFSCFTRLFREAQQPYSYDLGELGRYFRAYARLMAHWREVLPARVFLDVDYEALVDDPETQTRRLLAHCGLDWDPACLAFFKTKREVRTASAAQVRQPLYRGSIGRWRRFDAALAPLLAEVQGL